MNTQPEALRLAEIIETAAKVFGGPASNIASELRRLHQSEREGWRYADELEQERRRLTAVNQELLEALCKLVGLYDAMGAPRGPCRIMADAAIAKALGEAA